jgi:hypothetical protein
MIDTILADVSHGYGGIIQLSLLETYQYEQR